MNIIEPIIQGTITGIVLTLSFGAGFFALIQTSILRGYKKGMLIALGAILSDTLFIAIAIFATSFVSEELPKYAQTFKVVALVAFVDACRSHPTDQNRWPDAAQRYRVPGSAPGDGNRP